jgi:hypothetical protein
LRENEGRGTKAETETRGSSQLSTAEIGDDLARMIWESWKQTVSAIKSLVVVFLFACLLIGLGRNYLHLTMLPVFEETFDGWRRFLHWASGWLLFNWLEWIVNSLVYCLNYVMRMARCPFNLPQLHFYPWVKDVALVSVFFLRFFENVFSKFSREAREAARAATTEAQQAQIKAAQ